MKRTPREHTTQMIITFVFMVMFFFSLVENFLTVTPKCVSHTVKVSDFSPGNNVTLSTSSLLSDTGRGPLQGV